MSSRREFDDWYWWETNYNWHCSIVILLETNPNISTLGETQSSSLVGGGELIYWTGSTESLINIHQWESNNISLYMWRERGCSWTEYQWLDFFHLFWVVYDVWWLCVVLALYRSVTDVCCSASVMERDSTDLCPDLSCLTASRVGLVVAWREENVFSLWLWLYKLWTASGRCWEKPVNSAWLCDDVCCDTGFARTLYKHRTACGTLIIKYEKY